jgi:phage repressor protein C with HTH and peptisase S24 domain
MGNADPRAALERLIRERGEDYAGLSRLIGRNPAYVQQYVKRGSPRRLAEEDRRVLARYFDVDEALLGGTPPTPADQIAVPRLDVEASAGPGAAGAEDRALFEVTFDPRWLRRIGGDRRRLSMIEVRGDSMEPLLGDGDEILVDQGDAAARLRDGVYVLRREGALMVKRLSPHPGGKRVSVTSDNPAYPSWPDCEAADVNVVGRVIWAGKRIR